MTTLFSDKGLSMSRAQALSNKANQVCSTIERELEKANSCSKSIGDMIIQKGKALPSDTVEQLSRIGKLRGLQAFLMECIKLKKSFETSYPDFVFSEEPPKRLDSVEQVDESWGFSQLTDDEKVQYYSAEAMASTVGKFIHKNGKLDTLRKETSSLPDVEWMEVKKDEKTLIVISATHEDGQLLSLHNILADLHSEWETKLNYFKAKIKNLVSAENQRRWQKYSENLSAHSAAQKEWASKYQNALSEYNKKKTAELTKFSKMKIVVPDTFKDLVASLSVGVPTTPDDEEAA